MTLDLASIHAQAQSMSDAQWCEAWVRAADGQATTLALPEFPPSSIQTITNNTSGSATMRTAAAFYTVASEEIRSNVEALESARLLDHGAGWGRITRLMLKLIKPENLHAVDVDVRLVDAIKTHLPQLPSQLVGSGVALPFADESLDVVISNSVFSHLSRSAHLFYVEEIGRILRPGGLFLGTTLSLRHLEGWLERDSSREWITRVLGDPDDCRRRLAAGEFVYNPTSRWPDYGIAVLPDGWPAQYWAPLFTVKKVRTDYSQDIQVAVKRPSA